MVTETVFSQLLGRINSLIQQEGIAEPSEIQTRTIPAILDGKNVLVIAPTGTGKTYAAMLPVFQLFLQSRSEGEVGGISILYITPLRALNRDLLRRLSERGEELGIKVQVRHGDTTASARALQAKHPPNMLITTPETLQAILPGKRMKQHLKHVKWVIVDEVHEFATDKRGIQLSLGLERLRNLTEQDFQRIGLSATVGEPEKVAQFLVGTSRSIEVIKSTSVRKPEIGIEYVEPNEQDKKDADRIGVPSSTTARVRRIIELISSHKSTLVFTNTREHAEALGSMIQALRKGLPVKVHHGSLSREIRQEVEKQFQAGELSGVVCTSSLELGIDIGSVDFIIQYMSPREATRLIQRIGRSGHKITGTPKGTIISTSADDILESAVLTRRSHSERLERVKVHDQALDVLAHQIVGIVIDQGATPLDNILESVRRSYPYRDLDAETFLSVVKQLVDERILTEKENFVKARSPRTFHYYFENLSMIPDVKRFTVFDFIRKRRIGTLDQGFVARSCKPKVEFIMHGSTWRVVSVDEEKLTVDVEPVAPSLKAIPSWEGEMIPVDYKVANEVGLLRKLVAGSPDTELIEKCANDFKMNPEATRKVTETIREHVKDFDLPTDKSIVVEKFENCVVIHSCFGSLVNAAIAVALASLLSAKHGINVATQTDPYRIGLITPFKMDAYFVAKELQQLTPTQLETIIMTSVEGSETFAWRHWQVARRFGAVERAAEYRANRARFLVNVFKDTPLNQEAKREIFLEKLDLEGAKEVISMIQSGIINVTTSEEKTESCSPLAVPIVDKVVPHDLLRPAVPTKALADIVRERLQSETVKLVCMHKADWQGIRTVKDLPSVIRCPICKSTLVATTYLRDEQLQKIVKKKLQRKTLTGEENHEWSRGWTSASLVQNSGKRAVVAMSGRGVGPATAIRILRRFVRTEEEFYIEILKAERDYARTRMFWS